MKKRIILFSLLLPFLISGCNANGTSNSSINNESNTSESTKEIITTKKSNNANQLLTYVFDDEGRPLWMLVTGTDELLQADGNYQTIYVMESIQDNDIREKLQKKYDDGYALSFQLENDKPNGKIEMKKHDHETETLTVNTKKINTEYGKSEADRRLEEQKAKLLEEANATNSDSSSEESKKAVNSFDEAVVKVKQAMSISAEDEKKYAFYDFGLDNDTKGEYYHVVVRKDDDSSKDVNAKIYTKDGESVIED